MGIIKNKRECLLFIAIIALGISSVITQITAIREFLSVFYGNELIFGIILANWLFLTGIGAYLGKYFEKGKISLLIIAQIIIAFLPFFNIAVIRNLRNIAFLPGELIGIVGIFLASFFVLLPYCLISGFLLTLACCMFSLKKDSGSIGKVYFIDNMGGILGGILFSFIFIYLLNPFQMAFFLMIINLLSALLLSSFINEKISLIYPICEIFSSLVKLKTSFLYFINNKKFLMSLILLLMVLSFIGFFSIDLNKITKEQQYVNQELLFQKDTPYGNLVVTKTADQLNFYENGLTLFTTENTVSNEEAVHYAMLQAENPKNVLLISGGVSGTIKELLKYNVSRIDYLELDPLIIKLGREYTENLKSEKVNMLNKDGRLFVKQTKNRYDVIIINLPDPSTAQLNRFYTVEFFKELKKILNSDGVISLSLSGSENYLNIEARKLNSALYNSLKKYFRNIIIIPGDKNFFIAADKELSYDIVKLIKEKGIETKYVNEFYLRGKLSEDRINYVKNSLIPSAKPNKDFAPITYYYHLLYWMRQFRFDSTLFFIILFIFMVVYLIRIKPIPFVIFTSGFAASSLEVIILIGFQILYGYAYHQISIIIASFMAGLAIGSYYMNKKIGEMTKNELVRIVFSIAFYSILLPISLLLLSRIDFLISVSSQLLMPVFTIIIAALVGMEFPLASKLFFKGKVGETAGKLYNADLIGASIGALLVSALLIPIFGIFKVCLLIALLSLVSGIILKVKG